MISWIMFSLTMIGWITAISLAVIAILGVRMVFIKKCDCKKEDGNTFTIPSNEYTEKEQETTK
jgi:hypothetical protein